MFVGEDRIMEFMLTEFIVQSKSLPCHNNSRSSNVWQKPSMRGCKGWNRTPQILMFSSASSLVWSSARVMWREMLPARGSLWRESKTIRAELNSCQSTEAHSPWLYQILPGPVCCYCSAVDLYFLFQRSYSEFSVFITEKSKLYFAKCTHDPIMVFVMKMMLLTTGPSKPRAQNAMIVTIYGWICNLAESVFSTVSHV